MFANSALLEDNNGNTKIYRWEIASIAPLVPLLAFITALFVPESPVYLVGLLSYSIFTLFVTTVSSIIRVGISDDGLT